MKLTEKDKLFIERLRAVLDENGMNIELKEDGIKRLVLRGNYGTRKEHLLGMTRQGVRWRFQRLFSETYVEAYLVILFIETHFGASLRGQAMAIAKERAELWKKYKTAARYEMRGT